MSQENSRRLLIAGNWKMHKTAAEAADFINQLKKELPPNPEVDVTLGPAFTALESAVKAAAGSPVRIVAQNVFYEEKGAFTGEVSTGMLTAIGVSGVIIGHSERRQYFGETDETVNRRTKAALAAKLDPIVCVGETLEQREADQTLAVLETQVTEGLKGLDAAQGALLTLAYEPVWAIGTGKTATPEMAQEAHLFIRKIVEKVFDKGVANAVRILYGGSVKPANAAALMTQPDIDGALIGGASLKLEDFLGIINFS